MYKRAARSLGPLIALSLVSMPAISLAQNNKNDNRSTSTSTYNSSYRSDMSSPTWHSGKAAVMQTFLDKNFTQHDLIAILPLLQDLRDARQMCYAKEDAIVAELVTTKGDHQKLAGDTRLQECNRMLADRQRSIWNTISDRLGSDKAMALRNLAEPKTEDVSRVAYTDVYLQRIDVMLADLDKMAAARIAANGGVNPLDNSGVRQASVETTTFTTTVVPATPVYVTTPAAISERDLVNIVEQRIVADEIGNSEYMIMMPMHRDLWSSDITFLREGKMKVWW